MSLNNDAVRIANERLWAAHPELKRRQLSLGPEDAVYRKEWMQYYQEALSNQPPPPAIPPLPVSSPPPSSPVTNCPSVSSPTTVTDCKDVKNHVQEGDIVLRSTPGADSDLIRKAGQCDYSHAGIIVRNAKGELVVVDAYPRAGSAVAEEPIEDFFCGHGTFKGLVSRPKDCKAAQNAAQWAYDQTKDPDYKFDIFNPWDQDPKRLYCSDFVYQSFQNAGIEMVPNKMDFLSDSNKANTIAAAREFMKIEGTITERAAANIVPDAKIAKELRKKVTNSEYITPCQVAINPQTNPVVNYDPSAAKGSGDAAKKKASQ